VAVEIKRRTEIIRIGGSTPSIATKETKKLEIMKTVTAYKVGKKIFEDAGEARKEEIKIELTEIVEEASVYSNLGIDQIVEMMLTNEKVSKLILELNNVN